jgi:hypothetical protein
MDDFKRSSFLLILLVALPMVTVAQATGANQNSPPPLGKLVDVGGYRVHLYCTGSGSPTVVILGAGFSFDWGLVQPEVASITQVCSYDHSGSAWSDDGPTDSCSLRVSEIHEVLKNAGIRAPIAAKYVFADDYDDAGVCDIEAALVGFLVVADFGAVTKHKSAHVQK